MKNAVYLAGPMEDVSTDHMKGWRSAAADALNWAGIAVLDPTRRISLHDQLYSVEDKNDGIWLKSKADALERSVVSSSICNRIFKQDLQDIAESKIVLADVRRDSGRGTGTSMELMFAHTKNKIIILWANKDDLIHPFYEAMYSEKHYSIDEAIEAAMEYY